MRIALSLSKKLVNEFDEVLKNKGYNLRSKGIEKALEEYIVNNKNK